MPRTPMDFVEIEVYAHATEDPSRVEEAVGKIVPEEFRNRVRLSRRRLRGHYGNPIIVYRYLIDNDSERFLLSIIRRMSLKDRDSLRRSLDIHVDEHKILYLRFDKQEAYLGHLRVGLSDPICVRLKLKPHVFDRLQKLLKLGEG